MNDDSSKIGKLIGIGNLDTALTGLATSDNVAVDIEPGYGLFHFSMSHTLKVVNQIIKVIINESKCYN